MSRTKNKKQLSKKRQEVAKIQENPPFALLESFRNLVSNIGFAAPKKEGRARVICISSAVSGEGKSTVSVNLAVSCASTGAKTLLFDCDMRKPSVRRYFNTAAEKGLVDYLSGQASLQEVLCREVAPRLDVVLCRKTAPNPLALLKEERFENLLATFATQYEYIIIDTPPLGIVADALAVAEKTDGIVLVTRQMASTHPLIQRVIADIEFAGVNLLGFVLNDFNLKHVGKGYYKQYKYQSSYR